MDRPRKGQDNMYHRFSDLDGPNIFSVNKRTSPEEILAYATRVLNRETKASFEGKVNCETEEEKHNCATTRRRSSCFTCEENKSLLEAETLQNLQPPKPPKGKNKKTKGAAADENPPKAFAHTWDSCITVTKPLRKPSLNQLLERYPQINLLFIHEILSMVSDNKLYCDTFNTKKTRRGRPG